MADQKKQIGEDQFHTPELDAARQEIWDNGIKQVSRLPTLWSLALGTERSCPGSIHRNARYGGSTEHSAVPLLPAPLAHRLGGLPSSRASCALFEGEVPGGERRT